jgi:hypothetical protein
MGASNDCRSRPSGPNFVGFSLRHWRIAALTVSAFNGVPVATCSNKIWQASPRKMLWIGKVNRFGDCSDDGDLEVLGLARPACRLLLSLVLNS